MKVHICVIDILKYFRSGFWSLGRGATYILHKPISLSSNVWARMVVIITHNALNPLLLCLTFISWVTFAYLNDLEMDGSVIYRRFPYLSMWILLKIKCMMYHAYHLILPPTHNLHHAWMTLEIMRVIPCCILETEPIISTVMHKTVDLDLSSWPLTLTFISDLDPELWPWPQSNANSNKQWSWNVIVSIWPWHLTYDLDLTSQPSLGPGQHPHQKWGS